VDYRRLSVFEAQLTLRGNIWAICTLVLGFVPALASQDQTNRRYLLQLYYQQTFVLSLGVLVRPSCGLLGVSYDRKSMAFGLRYYSIDNNFRDQVPKVAYPETVTTLTRPLLLTSTFILERLRFSY